MIQATDIESAVLGLAIQHEKCRPIVFSELSVEDFTGENRKVYSGIKELYMQDDPINKAIVSEQFDEKGKEIVNELINKADGVNPDGVEDACDYLKPYRKGRDFKKLCEQYYRQADSNIHNIDEFLSRAGSEFFSLLSDNDTSRIYDSRDSLGKRLEELKQPLDESDRIYSGLDLDKITKGFKPGQLIIVGGRSSHGKSAFAQNIMQKAAFDGFHSVLNTMEMTDDEVNDRIYSIVGQVDYDDIDRHDLNSGQIKRLEGAKERINQTVGYTNVPENTTVDTLYALARRMKMQKNMGMLIVDYIQQVTVDAATREQEIAKVVKTLKQIAMDLMIPVIGLSQFKRESTQRPQLGHLKYSGAIENWANIAILLWNPSVDGVARFPDQGSEGKWARMRTDGIVELHIAKNRGGKTGTVKVKFDGQYQTFRNLSARERA